MDHTYIEENGLVERYYQGSLPPEEEAPFEEHFVGCPQCTEQLEMARGFQRGLKSMVAEDAARAVLVQAGLFAWLARRGRLAQWGLALAVLLIAAGLPAFWFRSESTGLRQTLAALQERWQSRDRDAADLQQRLAESDAKRRDLESKLAEAKPSAISPGNLAVVLLTAVRGDAGEPAATIDLSRTGPVLALALDPGPDAHFASYRVTLTRAGTTVFRQAGLQPNALETVMITFPATFFTAGEYRLRLEGMKPDGGASEIGGYPFRVVGKGA